MVWGFGFFCPRNPTWVWFVPSLVVSGVYPSSLFGWASSCSLSSLPAAPLPGHVAQIWSQLRTEIPLTFLLLLTLRCLSTSAFHISTVCISVEIFVITPRVSLLFHAWYYFVFSSLEHPNIFFYTNISLLVLTPLTSFCRSHYFLTAGIFCTASSKPFPAFNKHNNIWAD